MPDLDLGPNDYRKQDPETGRWLQNVDRRLCRVGSIAMIAFLCIVALAFVRDGQGATWPTFAFFVVGGFVAGGLFTLSLKRPDW